jgi:hypothetical protein
MPFQVVNPMAEMQTGVDRARANRLAQIQEADIVRARQQEAALNELYRQAYDPATGRIDTNKLYGGLAGQGYGTAISKMQAADIEMQLKRGQAAKALSEAEASQLKTSRDELASVINQAGYDAWRAKTLSQYGNLPNVDVSQIIPSQYSEETKQALLRTAEMINPKGEVRQIGGATATIDPYTGKQIGAAIADVPLPTDVVAQKKDIAAAGRTQVNVNTQAESEYGKKVAGQAAEDTNTQFKQAEAAVRGIAQTDRAMDLLEKGQPLTGLGADLELGIRRLQQTVAGRKDKTISDTELLEAVLGQDVFQQIQQLGIGARGLDTPAEREFLRQVISGTKTLNKDTLLQMAKIKRQAQEDIVNAWNQKTQSGELDDWYKYSKRSKKLLDIPKRESTPGQTALSAQDQQALDWANANPRDPRAAEIKKRLGVK